MKAIFVITLIVAVVTANRFNFQNYNNNNGFNTGQNINYRQFTQRDVNRQKFILNLLRYLKDDMNKYMRQNDYRQYSQTIDLDNKNNYKNLNKVFTFMTLFQNGWFQKRNQGFTLLDERNVITTKVAFDFFDTMTNWNTVAKNLIFCRRNMNEYQFWYLLTLLCQHNKFMSNIVLPPAYEVLPTQFFTGDVLTQGIQNAIKGNFNNYNKVVVMQNYTNGFLGSYDNDDNDNVNDLNKIEKKITDWNTLKQVVQNIKRDNQYINQQFVQKINRANKDMKTIVNNNARQQNQGNKFDNNGEDQMNYFTEDIGLNNYFYFTRMGISRIVDDNQMYNNNNNKETFNRILGNQLNNRELNDKITRRGERYIYLLQQLLARYNLERLSNNMDNVQAIDLDNDVQYGVFTNLKLTNGLQVQNRQNNMQLNTNKNNKLVSMIKDFENRFYQAIDQGFVQTQNGNKIDLRQKNGINILGNMLQDNENNVNQQFFRNLEMYYRQLLGGNYVDNFDRSDNRFTTTVMGTHETTLRDPVYWQIVKRIFDMANKYKAKLQGYTKNDLNFKGVQINNVKVDKMVTTFKYFDADITNGFNGDLIQMVENNYYNGKGNYNDFDDNDFNDSNDFNQSFDFNESNDFSYSGSMEDFNDNTFNGNWNENMDGGNIKNFRKEKDYNQFTVNSNSNSDTSSDSNSSSGSNSDENDFVGNSYKNYMFKMMKFLQQNMNTRGLGQNSLKKIITNIGQNFNINKLDNQEFYQFVKQFINECYKGNNFCNMGRNFNMQNIGTNYEYSYGNNNNRFGRSNFYGRTQNNKYNFYKSMMSGYNNYNDDEFQIITRQRRLTTKPFTITIDVSSNQNQNGIVRIFLGPRINNKQQLNDNRINFVEIDQFIVKLKQGQNTIQRNSIDFKNTVDDPMTFTKLIDRTNNMLNGNTQKSNSYENKNLYNVNFDTLNNNNGFPHRLVLPKGQIGGQDYTLFVVINDLDRTNDNDVKYWNNKNWNNFVKDTNTDNTYNGNNNIYNSDETSSSDDSSNNSDSNENFGMISYKNWNKFSKNQNKYTNNNYATAQNWMNNKYTNKYSVKGKMSQWWKQQGVIVYNCNNGNKNIGNGNGVLDKRAMGFPLDRTIIDFNGFVVDNMYFKDVTVYHQETSNN